MAFSASVDTHSQSEDASHILPLGPQSSPKQDELTHEHQDYTLPKHIDHIYHPTNISRNGTIDPFQTYPCTLPAEIVNTYLHYRLNVMTPRMIPSPGAKNPYIDAWLPVSISSPILFNALLFSSLTHKRIHSFLSTSDNPRSNTQEEHFLIQCQHETVTRVNRALKSHSSAVTDATILAVLMMIESVVSPEDREWNYQSPFKPPLQGLQWLNVHGARVPNMSHQAGLRRLVMLKGGLQNIKIPGAASAIFYRTLVNSTLTLSQPEVPFFSAYGHGRADLRYYFDSDPSRFDDGVLELRQSGLPSTLAYVLQGMKMYTYIVQEYVNGNTVDSNTQMMCDQRNLVQFHVMSLPPAIQLETSQRSSIYEACRLAFIIYSVGVLFPIPYVGSPLHKLAALLKRELDIADLFDRYYIQNGYKILFWLLAMGSIAATNIPERQWFVQKLAELSSLTSICRWVELKPILSSFIWLNCACDSAGEKLWDEVLTATLEPPGRHHYSTRPQPCRNCSHRKVKCDKQKPCKNCVKHHLNCIYRTNGHWQPVVKQLASGSRRVCQLCQQRKIRCDENSPCTACAKLGLPCSR